MSTPKGQVQAQWAVFIIKQRQLSQRCIYSSESASIPTISRHTFARVKSPFNKPSGCWQMA
ncbi:MAG: hypothetical protein K8R77_07510 [Anaerolineaceae bacterium]|nr:hypothetical protein [Anaerolineaceae bacterium]